LITSSVARGSWRHPKHYTIPSGPYIGQGFGAGLGNALRDHGLRIGPAAIEARVLAAQEFETPAEFL